MSDKIVAMLNKDLEGEHAAIIQYLVHAYAMGEGEMACEIEAIAREEMRHFDWLAETIVGLGGVPTIKRGNMRTGGDIVADWMKNDVLQEEEGIALYDEHIGAIDDRKIKRLLERILKLGQSHAYDHQISFDPTIMGDDARLNLGACLVRMGKLKEAQQCFRQLLDSPTRGKEATENLKAITRLRRG